MYAGHFAAGLALKASRPRTPTWAVLVGVGLCDLVFGTLVLAGVEHLTPTPGHAPGFWLDDVRWSHSALMSAVFALGFAALFVRRGAAVMATLALAVFSHFLLDWPMHPGDMTWYPGSHAHLGLGLWSRLPTGWWFVELGFIAACLSYYVVRARASHGAFGGRALWAAGVVVLLQVANAPWFSPVK